MQCSSCTAEVPEGSRFCNSCGVALPVRCRECAHTNAAGSRFCANCGARLTSDGLTTLAVSKPAPLSTFDTAERRQVTVMFCDLVGSTALSAGLDPEDLRAVISAYYREVAAEVRRFHGFVARHLGDGVLVYFGYPTANEDDAERAVRAGLSLISAIHSLEFRPEIALDARVGIATGLVVVERIGEGAAQEWAVLGDTPNLAARLQNFAEPGTVVIAPTTYRLIGELFECRALGPQEIKGLASPVHVWQVLRPGDVANRFWARRAAYTPIVGRVDEIELLQRRWQQAKTDCHPGILLRQAFAGQVIAVNGVEGRSLRRKDLNEHIVRSLGRRRLR
jgi:class 3 adenylate cyclase